MPTAHQLVRAILPAWLTIASAALAAAQPAAPAEPTTVDLSSGGVTIASGVNSLTIGARAQFRWTVDRREDFDADRSGTGVGDADGAFSQFDVPRMRVTLSGGVYRPWLRYSFQFDFSRTSGEGASKIKDAIIEIRPTAAARLTAGQHKVPFGLQELTSSGRQQFVDRSITDAKFAPARDTGVSLSGTFAARRVGYDVGVFNGSGEAVRQFRQSPLWVARAYIDPLGPNTLSESAVDAGAEPVLHLGIAVRGGAPIRGRTPAGVVQDADRQRALGLEVVYKTSRFFSTAEYFRMTDGQQNPVALPDLEAAGFHAQAGFMIVPRATELAIRFARIEGDTAADDAAVSELRGGVGQFWRGHNLKLQADIGQLRYGPGYAGLSARARAGLPALGSRLDSGRDLADVELRVQLQVAF